jgi:hypothetical protein
VRPTAARSSHFAAMGSRVIIGSMFDLLINSEVFVDDVALAERVFVEALGFPAQRESWSGKVPGFGFTY